MVRASSRGVPRATSSSTCDSTWKRSSSSRSRSTDVPRSSERRRSFNASRTRMTSRRPDDEVDGFRQPFPAFELPRVLRPPGACQRIHLRPPSGVALGPLGRDPALLLEPMQRRIERALLHLQDFARHLLDALGDGPAVRRLKGKRLQDQEIQGALDEIGGFAHMPRPSTNSVGFVDDPGIPKVARKPEGLRYRYMRSRRNETAATSDIRPTSPTSGQLLAVFGRWCGVPVAIGAPAGGADCPADALRARCSPALAGRASVAFTCFSLTTFGGISVTIVAESLSFVWRSASCTGSPCL